MPIYTGTIGTLTFLASGAIAVSVFILFTIVLRLVGRERFAADVWPIRVAAFAVLAAINVSYFTGILPPLPLSMESAGIYHEVWRAPGMYMASGETNQSWQVRRLGFAPALHITYGESLYAYSAVFAPTSLTTTIVHRWQWYDPIKKEWATRSTIAYPIIGGRDGGYRGYSAVPINDMGKWRVNVETSDGRLIARLPFTVAQTAFPPLVETITLK